ncbi:MAG TPA: T9SS type A sorting domain-containing protein [Bacteroidia bacterium]|nr:T9SS type A sorting domain-containing protein [Bacteroidia bacterium]
MRTLLRLSSYLFLPSAALLSCGTYAFAGNGTAVSLSGCSVAGTAAATADSVCYTDTVALTLSGYTGTIQWQHFDGTNWVDDTDPNALTDNYPVSLLATTDFRALVTQSPCPADTSNTITITVGTIPVPAAIGVSRCGPGMVTLTGTGSGTLQWYNGLNATSPFATGDSVTTYVPASTTLYVSDQSVNIFSSPIQVTEMELDLTDHLEIMNVSPIPIDVTGWKVAINDSYTDINLVNPVVQTLNGVMNPGDAITFTDVTGTPYVYWGVNILWNPGAFPGFSGWALILDDQNNLMDFVPLNWPAADIQNMSITVNGATLTPGLIWSGDGVDITATTGSTSVQRVVSHDNNVNTDFANQPVSTNMLNTGLTLPFTGFGCLSPKVPVQVTITNSDPVTINASATNFCLNGSATLTATSLNPNYVYTWSPATGLNTTTGATVTSTPPGPGIITYAVFGDDGTCSNVDSITIDVGTPTAAGTAITYADTICLGFDTDLILNGSSGTIQWQSLSGGVWVNETGPGANSSTYSTAPTVNTTYRAYLSSGSCPPDSSNSLDIVVVSVQNPVTTDSTVCTGGQTTLYATGGQGTLLWYNSPTNGQLVNQGNSYTFTAAATTTFYVEEFAGTQYHIGATNPGIGSQSTVNSTDWGLGFDVSRDITIDYVNVYPGQSGNVTINLRQAQGGPILATQTQAVTAFTGAVPIYLNFAVPAGTGYRLELAAGSVPCTRNTSGAVYPYTAPNGPLTIVGYLTPALNTTGTTYQFLYDWVVSEGCRSQRVPATYTVSGYPPLPIISQNGNVLTSSAPAGNQWIFNGGVLAGQNGQTLTITQTGTYAVAVTVNGCTTLSPNFVVTSVGIGETNASEFSVYPNPASDMLNISVADASMIKQIVVFDLAGKKVYSSEVKQTGNNVSITTAGWSQGSYTIELTTENNITRKRFNIAR